MTEIFTVFLCDSNDDDAFPVYVDTPLVPRVGERIHYWIDYPTHTPDGYEFEAGEPWKIDGIVERVEIEYRRMSYSKLRRIISSASVYLTDYTVTLPKQTNQ